MKAVSFDLWGTIIHESPFQIRVTDYLRVSRLRRLLAQAGYPVGVEILRRAYHETWRRCEALWSTNKDIPTFEQVTMLLSLIRSELPNELDETVLGTLEAAYVDPVFVAPPALDPDAEWLLSDLKKAGVKIGLICNTGRTPGWALRRLLRAFGIEGYFTAMLFSNEEGIRKPSPQVFLRLLERLGAIEPSQAVHVGDDPTTDIPGAVGIGMGAILIDPHGNKPTTTEPNARIASLRQLPEVLALMPKG